MELQRDDIQGLVFSSYQHLPHAAYLLLEVNDAPRARAWLASILPHITTAREKKGGSSLNAAFSFAALRKLEVEQSSLAAFSLPFQEGMATTHRSRILGDVNENEPARWNWGGPENSVDILLLIFAEKQALLEDLLCEQESVLPGAGLRLLQTLRGERQPGDAEHFGFKDGIGQPVMEGSDNEKRQKQRTNHATTLPAGEFLLGHSNVYGIVSGSRPDAAGETVMPELLRNGTYLVFRQLAQDVALFSQFLRDAAARMNPPLTPEHLGAKCVGRWPSGAPLVLSPERDNPALSNENNFQYAAADEAGTKCPLGSHIRRSNPRDMLGADKQKLLFANRHRILRRGRSYGPRIADPLVDDKQNRGLQFICLNADLERQFEFVQQTWINNPIFGVLSNEVDPLVGSLEQGNGTFTVQTRPLRQRVTGLKRFVTVKGGTYFFLPSMSFVRFLSAGASAGIGASV